MPTAQKNSVRSFDNGAPPEKTIRNRPPVPALIFEYTNLSDSAHCSLTPKDACASPHRHLADWFATFIAQSNSLRFTPVVLLPCSTIRVYIFSNTRGTAESAVGCSSTIARETSSTTSTYATVMP